MRGLKRVENSDNAHTSRSGHCSEKRLNVPRKSESSYVQISPFAGARDGGGTATFTGAWCGGGAPLARARAGPRLACGTSGGKMKSEPSGEVTCCSRPERRKRI